MKDIVILVLAGSVIVWALATLVWMFRVLLRAKPKPVVGSKLDSQWPAIKSWHAEQSSAHSAATIWPKPKRASGGKFDVNNRPPNAGASKQIERLRAAGIRHAGTTVMMDACCSKQERAVLHMRQAGQALPLIADRLGISVSKVRRLERSAVEKIIAIRKKA